MSSRFDSDLREVRTAELGRAVARGVVVAADFRGVVLRRASAVTFEGLAQVSREDVEACSLRPLQRLLVATLVGGGVGPSSWNLSANRVLFNEDEEDMGAFVIGRFRLGLPMSECDSGWLSVSWGPFVSNVLPLGNTLAAGVMAS